MPDALCIEAEAYVCKHFSEVGFRRESTLVSGGNGTKRLGIYVTVNSGDKKTRVLCIIDEIFNISRCRCLSEDARWHRYPAEEKWNLKSFLSHGKLE